MLTSEYTGFPHTVVAERQLFRVGIRGSSTRRDENGGSAIDGNRSRVQVCGGALVHRRGSDPMGEVLDVGVL